MLPENSYIAMTRLDKFEDRRNRHFPMPSRWADRHPRAQVHARPPDPSTETRMKTSSQFDRYFFFAVALGSLLILAQL